MVIACSTDRMMTCTKYSTESRYYLVPYSVHTTKWFSQLTDHGDGPNHSGGMRPHCSPAGVLTESELSSRISGWFQTHEPPRAKSPPIPSQKYSQGLDLAFSSSLDCIFIP